MKNEAKSYKKQNSFANFVSNISASPEEQTRRALDALIQAPETLGKKDNWSVILNSIKEDLTAGDKRFAGFKINPYSADEMSRIESENLPRYLYYRYRYEMFPLLKKVDTYPPCLQIEPTPICNYRCVFCYQQDRHFFGSESGAMSLDLFKSIIDQSVGNIEFISLASRGEPLLCLELSKMLEYCRGKFMGMKLNTNASALNEKLCHELLSGGLNTIVFSIDAADKETYRKYRVRGDLDRVMKNVVRFQDIRRNHYPDSKIITRVSGVMYDSEEQKIDDLVDCWAGYADQVSFVAYNPWEDIYNAEPVDLKSPCSDLWRRMFIWHNGIVNPCDSDYKSLLTVGNANSQSITDLWHSSKYQLYRKKHVAENRAGLFPCSRCKVI